MSEDFDVDDELGFAPAVPATGSDPAEHARPAKTARRRHGVRRRVLSLAVLVAALGSMGGAYALFASSSGAADQATSQAQISQGHQLFDTSCITCHGANLQGVPGRGVSLLGAGGAAVYFQVSTGRMPATQQGAENPRKPAKFTEDEINALAAYVQSVGGGATVPSGDLRQSTISLGAGGDLFRLNCASCHSATGKGAPLSAGVNAPSLVDATDKQLYTAMLSGPEQMPVFSDNQLTPDQKKAIIDYIQTIKSAHDPGGLGIGRIGPVSEGLVVWIVGIGAVVITILWIGAKS